MRNAPVSLSSEMRHANWKFLDLVEVVAVRTGQGELGLAVGGLNVFVAYRNQTYESMQQAQELRVLSSSCHEAWPGGNVLARTSLLRANSERF